MATFPLFSKQVKAQAASLKRGPLYQYHEMPPALRNQVLRIFERLLGSGTFFKHDVTNDIWWEAKEILRNEYGMDELIKLEGPNASLTLLIPGSELTEFFRRVSHIAYCLDVIQ